MSDAQEILAMARHEMNSRYHLLSDMIGAIVLRAQLREHSCDRFFTCHMAVSSLDAPSVQQALYYMVSNTLRIYELYLVYGTNAVGTIDEPVNVIDESTAVVTLRNIAIGCFAGQVGVEMFVGGKSAELMEIRIPEPSTVSLRLKSDFAREFLIGDKLLFQTQQMMPSFDGLLFSSPSGASDTMRLISPVDLDNLDSAENKPQSHYLVPTGKEILISNGLVSRCRDFGFSDCEVFSDEFGTRFSLRFRFCAHFNGEEPSTVPSPL